MRYAKRADNQSYTYPAAAATLRTQPTTYARVQLHVAGQVEGASMASVHSYRIQMIRYVGAEKFAAAPASLALPPGLVRQVYMRGDQRLSFSHCHFASHLRCWRISFANLNSIESDYSGHSQLAVSSLAVRLRTTQASADDVRVSVVYHCAAGCAIRCAHCLRDVCVTFGKATHLAVHITVSSRGQHAYMRKCTSYP
jgi:hypothetical protein